MSNSIRLFVAALCILGSAAHAQEVNGRDVFKAACAMCHQAEAQGAAGVAPPLKGSYWNRLAAIPTYVPGVLLVGLHGPIVTDEGTFNGIMPPQNRLSDREIAAVANFLLQDVNGQSAATAVTVDSVAALRAAPPAVTALRALRKQALAK